MATVLVLAGAVALPASAAVASSWPAAVDVSGACADESGVTVVVDATELEGDVTVGCASDPATGTEALAQAGIAETRDPSGYICAVGGLPDPCPTEFTGSYWSYWTAAPGGEWTAYAEGSDTAVPAAGSVEGWRYGDGTQPPAVAPADVRPGVATVEAEPTTDADAPAADQAADDAVTAVAPQDGGDGVSLAVGVAVGVAIVGALVGLIVRLRRQSQGSAKD
ncbi:hypothetical protein N867_03010 [Actinotalea fermentans ATCC 43279 = JCM 9966 = DSM 3133]|nr:hypothetical protein N867_03010 [Actinotalea fermentans ATCC 43279 = JCM 9966 = DSM 3133]